LLDAVRRACGRAGVDPAAIEGAGVASVGPFDRDGAVSVDPPNVDRTDIRPVAPLRELLRTDRIVLNNDAIAGVIGERAFADAATENMVYLTLSTGVGAGVVVDGSVLSGHGGNAGEVGHVTLDPDETMACGCGAAGHWEAYCGGANIPSYASHLAAERDVETSLPVDGELTARDVFERVGTDDLADLVVERIADWNVLGVATVVHAYAPSYVAVGGAVARENPEAVIEPIRERVPDRLTVPTPEIHGAETGADVVLKGALVTARGD
jgi:glucokinase